MFLRALGEGGLVAAGLLVGFFVSLFALGALVRRRLDRGPALVLAASLAVAAYFAVHVNFDWLEEIPAVASPALALPLVGLAAAAAQAAGPAAPSRRARAAGLTAGAVGLVALLSLVPAYLSVRYSDRADRTGAADPDAAFADLDRARSLNPASVDPDLAEGRIAIAARRYPHAREAFERSLEVEDNWLAHFELSLLEAHRGRFGPAAAELRLARELNARDPVLFRLSRDIRNRIRVDPTRENQRIQRAAQRRFTTSGR
jgi:tetratricopeptide (TPR) repeat protein